jgi:hypothetical protein
MSHKQLGQTKRAGACYAEALQWMQAHPDLDPAWAEELCAFQEEARVVLGK